MAYHSTWEAAWTEQDTELTLWFTGTRGNDTEGALVTQHAECHDACCTVLYTGPSLAAAVAVVNQELPTHLRAEFALWLTDNGLHPQGALDGD